VKLAVIILTHNEERHIEACIRSAAFADEILVIDDMSTDRTAELAQSLGARVATHPLAGDFAGQRNFALMQTDADWVLYVDADERVNEGTEAELRRIMAADARAVYEIKRINIVFGQRMYYGGHHPDYIRRFFPRDAAHWTGIVHERAESALPVRRIGGSLLHYTYESWEQYLRKFNLYTTLMAERRYAEGQHTSFLKILLDPPFAFFRFYVIQRGVLDGRLGFIMAMCHGFYTMIKYVKLAVLWQMHGAESTVAGEREKNDDLLVNTSKNGKNRTDSYMGILSALWIWAL